MDIPPKLTHRNLRLPATGSDRETHLGFGRGRDANVLSHAGLRTPGSSSVELPVLGAIQQFIDQQRRRVRRTMLTVTVLFLALMVSVVAVGAVVGRIFFDQMRDDMKNERIVAMKETEAGLEKIRSDASRALDTAVNESRNGDLKLETAYSASVEEVRKNALAQIAAVGNKFADGMSDIQIENADLAGRYVGLKKLVESLRAENADMREQISNMRWNASVSPEPLLSESTTLSMATTNARRTVNWRLPMPSLRGD